MNSINNNQKLITSRSVCFPNKIDTKSCQTTSNNISKTQKLTSQKFSRSKTCKTMSKKTTTMDIPSNWSGFIKPPNRFNWIPKHSTSLPNVTCQWGLWLSWASTELGNLRWLTDCWDCQDKGSKYLTKQNNARKEFGCGLNLFTVTSISVTCSLWTLKVLKPSQNRLKQTSNFLL